MANYVSNYKGKDLDGTIKLTKGSVASSFIVGNSYIINDIVVYEDDLYKCIKDCSGAWDESNWTRIKISDYLETMGTVKNIATGNGLTGGPITSSGTLSVDFTEVSSKGHIHSVSATAAASASTGQSVLTSVKSAGQVPTLGTAITADDITNWSAGSFVATPEETESGSGIYNLNLTFTAPNLSYTAKSIPNITNVGSMPTFNDGTVASSNHTHNVSGTTGSD